MLRELMKTRLGLALTRIRDYLVREQMVPSVEEIRDFPNMIRDIPGLIRDSPEMIKWFLTPIRMTTAEICQSVIIAASTIGWLIGFSIIVWRAGAPLPQGLILLFGFAGGILLIWTAFVVIYELFHRIREAQKDILESDGPGDARKIVVRMTVVELLAANKSKRIAIASSIILASGFVYYFLCRQVGSEANVGALTFVWLLVFALKVNHITLTYRIRKGLYGATESEARELIKFILSNSDKTDFSDKQGLRQLLVDPKPETRTELLPETGLEGAKT